MYWHINDYKVCKHKYAIGENSNEKIMAGYLWNNGTSLGRKLLTENCLFLAIVVKFTRNDGAQGKLWSNGE